jgi:hypothetical protein
MRIVLTLVVRDEADIVDQQLRYHLGAGIDFVIASDHRSTDGTTDILERHEREGRLRLIRRTDDGFFQSRWVTEMARLAATEHGADWVINADADEFWWPRDGSLRDVLEAVPRRFGVLRGIWRHFVLRPHKDEPFDERMVVRRLASPDIADPYRTQVKVAHRADAAVMVPQGGHDAFGERLVLLREWFPFEVLHFPIRDREQLERKYSVAEYESGGRVPNHTADMEAKLQKDFEATYRRLLVDEGALQRGISEGTLFIDTRLRDVLKGASSADLRRRSLLDDVQLASEIDTFLETDAARRLEPRASSLEQRLAPVETSAAVVLTHLLHRTRARP